ncbi:ABC transporter permease [Clostridium hydrogenum]|uniref:ABC transporter permease n=1 Tax=Clostridium hydrogenum TaxID=2855764 RepID=UPI001F353AAB|nr:FtsX-like permease family protein [Clostridium hydrogenum]
MKKTFFKNLFRSITKTFSRFLSILIIIAVGVAFYVGVRATSPDMKKSGDYYFDKTNFMDFKLVSTLGFTKDSLSSIKNIKDVSKVEGSKSIDAVIEKNKRDLIINVNSLPVSNGINQIIITKGRKPNNYNEVVVEEEFLKKNNYKIGDEIVIKSGNETNINDELKNNKFKIVGTADSPLYVSEQRQISSVGDGVVRGFVYILPSVFKNDIYTEVYVKTNKSEDKNSLDNNDDYKKANKDIENSLKKVLGNINKERYEGIKTPEFYVLGRSQNIGYESYRQDSNRIDDIGKVFPLIFFLVAALVSLTTMTRMVQENRIEIGTFKALGYSKMAIISHYLIYSLAASILGTIVGVIIGFRLFPPLIMNAYESLYKIPYSMTPFNLRVSLMASSIAIFFIGLAAVASTIEELREVPASLMRPKSPKAGKVILLERFTFIWKRLKFTSKVTARNIFRYKQRFFMTVVGVAACTGLIITGFGLKSGIKGSVAKQYDNIYKYDMQVNLNTGVGYNEKDEIGSKVIKDSNVKSIMFMSLKNGTITNDGTETDAYVVIPENKNSLGKYINLTMKGKKLSLEDNGVIVTQKLLKLAHKSIGDDLDITIDGKIIKVKIADVTEQYIGNYVYISPKYYEKVSGEKLEFDGFYGVLKSTAYNAKNKTLKEISDIGKVSSVSFKDNAREDAIESMKSIDSVVVILIVSAGVLAFVVIYNLTNININERKRELATIKLLGFYNNELAAYIYRENIVLTIIGSLVGIIFGIIIYNFVIVTAETNQMMFLRTINPINYVYSILFTIGFSVIVNLAMYSRFDKIDMVESLKSAE